jgi:hypothetical protein
VGSHRAQGPALRRSRDLPTPAAGSSTHRAPSGRRSARRVAPPATPAPPAGWLEAVVSQPADLSAPIEPVVVALGARRARREAERLAESRRAASPRREARRTGATAVRTTPARGSALVLVGGGLPRVGIAAALGLATIVTPVVGSMGSTADASSTAAPVVPRTVSRAATTIALAPAMAESFRVVPGSSTEVVAAPPARLAAAAEALTAEQLAAIRDQATQASRTQERAALPGCAGKPVELSAANGRIDRDDLCELWSGEYLRADAAVALARLNAEFASRFGRDICITDGYRSYSEQVTVRWQKPGLAARPGTSQHGWGLAVDLCKGEASSGADEHEWLEENAPDFGWDNPAWARSGGSGPFEPWHWEYVAGQDARS